MGLFDFGYSYQDLFSSRLSVPELPLIKAGDLAISRSSSGCYLVFVCVCFDFHKLNAELLNGGQLQGLRGKAALAVQRLCHLVCRLPQGSAWHWHAWARGGESLLCERHSQQPSLVWERGTTMFKGAVRRGWSPGPEGSSLLGELRGSDTHGGDWVQSVSQQNWWVFF